MSPVMLRSVEKLRRPGRVCGAVTAFAGVPLVASLVGERGPLADIDRAAFAAVRARRSPAGIIAARVISALAEPGVAYPVAVLAGIGASRRSGWRRGCIPPLVAGWLFAVGWLWLTDPG